jgi:hypothetical protein
MQKRLRTIDNGRGAAAGQVDPPVRDPGLLHRSLPLTDMPTWLMLVLAAAGLPRTLLADLGIVAPDSSLLYFFLALAPFAVWLTVAIAMLIGAGTGVVAGLVASVAHLWRSGRGRSNPGR